MYEIDNIAGSLTQDNCCLCQRVTRNMQRKIKARVYICMLTNRDLNER